MHSILYACILPNADVWAFKHSALTDQLTKITGGAGLFSQKNYSLDPSENCDSKVANNKSTTSLQWF